MSVLCEKHGLYLQDIAECPHCREFTKAQDRIKELERDLAEARKLAATFQEVSADLKKIGEGWMKRIGELEMENKRLREALENGQGNP